MKRAYAQKTTVNVDRTQAEIRSLVEAHGADRYAVMEMRDRDKAVIAFRLRNRNIRFDLPLVRAERMSQTAYEQFRRVRWRAMLLCIKAKLEAVAVNIETLDEAFLANIQMPEI